MSIYNKIDNKELLTEFKVLVDRRLDHVYNKLKKIIITYYNNNNTIIRIFIAINSKVNSVDTYDYRLDGYFLAINDGYIEKKLIKKFKNDKIELKIYSTKTKDQMDAGKILYCKSKRTNNSCIML